MATHSSAITAQILSHPNPLDMRDTIWSQTRYLVAQKPKTEDFAGTDENHYHGKHVLPGPKADSTLVPLMENMDIDQLEAQYGITFVDFQTTEGADLDVVQAPYTIMSTSEADDFERQLRNQ